MAVTETTERGWFSRIGDSIKGIFGGFILIIIAIILLGWNEKRSVDRYETIDFAKNNFVESPADSIDASKEGKLVHFNGAAKTSDILTDPEFGVTVDNSYSLRSNVEMYQWVEQSHSHTEKKAGGKEVTTTTYTYKKEWCSSVQNSSSFKESGHDNPTVLPHQSNTTVAENVTIGAHKIPSSQTKSLGTQVPVELEEAKIKEYMPKSAIIDKGYIYYNLYNENKAKQALQGVVADDPAHHQPAPEAAQTTVENTQAAVENTQAAVENTQAAVENTQAAVENTPAEETAVANVNMANFYATPSAPQIGDIRISFTHNPVGDATVVAKQTGDTVAGYQTKTGEFYEVRTGLLTAEQVFQAAEEENAMMTWILRGLGILMIYGGFCMIFKPISVLADVVPLFGNIAETGISMISGLLAIFIGTGVIAIAWLFCRPVLAIFLFILMGAAIFGIVTLIKKTKAAKAAAAPAPAAEPAPETPAAN